MQYVTLKGAGHFMFRRVRLWHTLATGFVMKAFAESTGADVAVPAGLARCSRNQPSR